MNVRNDIHCLKVHKSCRRLLNLRCKTLENYSRFQSERGTMEWIEKSLTQKSCSSKDDFLST